MVTQWAHDSKLKKLNNHWVHSQEQRLSSLSQCCCLVFIGNNGGGSSSRLLSESRVYLIKSTGYTKVPNITDWLSGLIESFVDDCTSKWGLFWMYSMAHWCDLENIHTCKYNLHGCCHRDRGVDSLFTACGAAPVFVSGWHHCHSLSLCELQCLSGVLLWWNVVIYFCDVPSFPLPASSASTSLSDCLHRMPFNSPQSIALNVFYSAEGYTCRWRE